jgi:hypothetical protein
MSYSQDKNDNIDLQCESRKDDKDDKKEEPIGFIEYMKRTINNIHPGLMLYLTSLFMALIIILLIRPVIDNLFPLFVVLMSAIIFVVRDNMTGNNIAKSLPSTTYPRPPHLGLSGVNLENRYPYQYVN